jgi:hypothetical protein
VDKNEKNGLAGNHPLFSTSKTRVHPIACPDDKLMFPKEFSGLSPETSAHHHHKEF